MRVALMIDPGRLRRWHADLAANAARVRGVSVSVRRTSAQPHSPVVSLLLALDGLINRVPAGNPAEAVECRQFQTPLFDVDEVDIVIDLVGAPPPDAPVVLAVRCNGQPIDDGALDAVLARSVATLTLEWLEGGHSHVIARWPVAVEDDVSAIRAMGTVLARARQLATIAITRLADGRPPSALDLPTSEELETTKGTRIAPLAFAGRSLVTRARRRLDRILGTGPRWTTGFRLEAPLANGLPDLSAAPFTRLRDDGRRFYADPFLVGHRGETFVFVEEFPFATRRGVISAARIAADGTASTPRPVMEADVHLSYPFLLEIDGVVHMIPETSARRTVELWRAVSFPDRWEKVATLLSDVDLSDATLLRRPDGWVMFAASRASWASSWDALDVYVAETVTGPWRPMGANPMRVDVRSVRPGGAVLSLGGRMVRPVQDCSTTYGGGLAFTAIDRVDRGGFEERIVRRITPGHPFGGFHTYNRASGFEVVDVFGPSAPPTFALPAGWATDLGRPVPLDETSALSRT